MKPYMPLKAAWDAVRRYGPPALFLAGEACTSIETRNGVEKVESYTDFSGGIFVYTDHDTARLPGRTYVLTEHFINVDASHDTALDAKVVSRYTGRPVMVSVPLALPNESMLEVVSVRMEHPDTAYFIVPGGKPVCSVEKVRWHPKGTVVKYIESGSDRAAMLQEEFECIRKRYEK